MDIYEQNRNLLDEGWSYQGAKVCAIAKLEIPFHHHMLRHSCGYALAAKGHDTRPIQEYLGHRSIEHTVVYTGLSTPRGSRASGESKD